MGLDKPQDFAIVLGIFSIIFILVGLSVSDINDRGATINESQFNTFTNNAATQAGFKGIADNSISTLQGEDSSNTDQSVDSFLTQGFTGIINLGQSWGIMWDSMNTLSVGLGINPIFLMIIAGIVAIIFVIVIYSWIRRGS